MTIDQAIKTLTKLSANGFGASSFSIYSKIDNESCNEAGYSRVSLDGVDPDVVVFLSREPTLPNA